MTDMPPVKHIALISEQRGRVRELSGFRKKTHQIPTDYTDRTQAFVGQIANDEVGEDLDKRFAEFRKHFSFKRAELRVSDPEGGCGIIATPWFEYQMTITQAPDDPVETIWRRQVTGFRNPEPLFSPEFAAVFGNLFNTVEFEPPEPIDMEAFVDAIEDRNDASISIDYDRNCTWCELNVDRIPGRLTVHSDCIAFTTHQADLPRQLLSAFFEFRSELSGIECF